MRCVLGMALFLVACGGDAAKEEPKPHKPPPSAAPSASAPVKAEGSKGDIADARKRALTNDDFAESETNRDPFRSFLPSFAVQVQVNKQHKIILERFGVEELKLAAIVAGESTSPRAMFIDPTGMGVTVVRGDHMSKSDATVTRIAPDRVFLQMEEDSGGKPKMVERVLELHAGELSTP